MDKCDSCNNSFKYQYEKFYKNKYNDLYNIFLNTKINNNDIINTIFSFLTYFKHSVKHQCKKRIPTPSIDDNDYDSDFDNEYYWDEKKNICTFCFQTGIINSLNIQKRLPFLRRDIWLFIDPDINFDKNIVDFKKEYDSFYYNYKLPLFYNITYYRNKQPIKINDTYIITSN